MQKYKGLWDYCEQLCGNKMDNWEELDRFLEKFNIPWLNQKEEIMNNPITSTEIEAVIQNLWKNISPEPDGLTGEFYQTFREELMPILLKLFQKFAEEEHYQMHSKRSPSPWYQNQTKTTHKKENYRPISLMNMDAKILNEILANRIQQHIKKLIHHNQVEFIPGCKDSSAYASQSMWWWQDTEKTLKILSENY